VSCNFKSFPEIHINADHGILLSGFQRTAVDQIFADVPSMKYTHLNLKSQHTNPKCESV
jgi:hypothetical protein